MALLHDVQYIFTKSKQKQDKPHFPILQPEHIKAVFSWKEKKKPGGMYSAVCESQNPEFRFSIITQCPAGDTCRRHNY